MRGLSHKEELIFYLEKVNAAEEAVPSFAIGEMRPVWRSQSLTISSSFVWEFIFGAHMSNSFEGLIAIDDISVDIDRVSANRIL
jgi:hypothetical protein